MIDVRQMPLAHDCSLDRVRTQGVSCAVVCGRSSEEFSRIPFGSASFRSEIPACGGSGFGSGGRQR